MCLSRILAIVSSSARGSQSQDDNDKGNGNGSGNAIRHLDGMYVEILARSLAGRKSTAHALNDTLDAIAVLQGPLSAVSLATLMPYKGPEMVYQQLRRLHSVVRISTKPNTPI